MAEGGKARVEVVLGDLDLVRVAEKLKNSNKIFAALAVELLKEIDRNFQAEGIWTKWAPLRPNTKYAHRSGQSAKALQTLRSAFREEHDASSVRVGSPSKIAKYHHEGRKGPWTILPKRAKALAFPVAFQTYGMGGKVIQGASLKQRYGSVGIRAGGSYGHVGSRKFIPKIVEFKSFGHAKRSKQFLGTANMAVVRGVKHPGYPPRPMLPPEAAAMKLANEVISAMLMGEK